jgi:hypothetical protein
VAVGADVISSSILDCHTDVATDEVREASQSHAFDSPVPGECRSTNSSADEEACRRTIFRLTGLTRVFEVPVE